MKRLTNPCMLLALASLCAASLGCGMRQSASGLNILPVSSLATIAGDWEGLSKTVPEMRDDARVMLLILEKGFFHFISDRGTEMLVGTGTLTTLQGTVLANGQRGAAMLTLHDRAGAPVLVVQAALSDGHHYYMEMTRLK